MNDSNFMQQPDSERMANGEWRLEGEPPGEPRTEGEAPDQPPELPPLPELPKPPEARFERPKLEPLRSPRLVEASRGTAIAFSIGFALAGPIIVGTLLGVWLDNSLTTTPWLTLILLLLGVVAGFTQMIRLLNRLQNEQEHKP